MTNKADWDKFSRSKDRFKVYDFYSANKTECFNMWLECNKDWNKVSSAVERLHESSTEGKRGWIATQGKDIRKTHDADKADQVIAARKASGMWFQSEDFPDDDDAA